MAEDSSCVTDTCISCVETQVIDRPVFHVPASPAQIRFSEIISALSVALDLTQGNRQGHSMRTALIGMRLAEELQLHVADRSALFYALLLKDVGCSSNAAKISYLFGADDHRVKRSIRLTNWTNAGENLKNCWRQCAPGGGALDKLMQMAALARSGMKGAKQLSQTRCERGASIARMLHLPEPTARAILDLDEHWDGRGHPLGRKHEEISLLGRICCLAQTVELFCTAYGLSAAFEVARERRGSWFDPELVDLLGTLKSDESFWSRLTTHDLPAELSRWEPADEQLLADDACLDRVAEAFANVVDAKSPWTYQHSIRVADIAVGVARQFACGDELLRDLRRAALLHDIGKLGVSNLILDKPGKPDDQELEQIRKHPDYSQQILQKVAVFGGLAEIAGAHHERLDGRGYHRQLSENVLPWMTRVLTVADVCEALTARRPYRRALAWPEAREIMFADAGAGFDRECLQALARWYDRVEMQSRVDEQLQAVDRLLAELH
ncbi:MAG TPA: HD domain-containing phosphohydrolase [Pirellulales bacterium]|jgi:putative nucleotidyltransferase with HDIG domain